VTPTARIVLVRHGPSAYVFRPGRIDRDGVHRWRDEYDVAGIRADSQPPQELVQLAAGARHVVSSDLRRAVESAERLVLQRELVMSSLLRETMLDVPRWPTRMPAIACEALAHLVWGYRVLRGMDTTNADRARAIEAARWLADLVADGSTAVVVTHGVFRRQISLQLRALGWISAGRIGGYDNWSTWSFVNGPSL